MKLKIKRGLSKTVVTTPEKQPLFIIKNKEFLSTEKIILNHDGTEAYSIKKDPKPLDSRDKYIFTDHATKNEFYAWVDCDIYKRVKAIPFFKFFFFSPFEIFIEAESFFGELCIKRGGISSFDIFLNGKKHGAITGKSIVCDSIDDAALLTVLYAFTDYISSTEENYRTEDIV